MKNIRTTYFVIIVMLLSGCQGSEYSKDNTLNQKGGFIHFNFDKNVKSKNHEFIGKNYSFVKGIDGNALNFKQNNAYNSLYLSNVKLNGSSDFSIQCWIKTSSENPTVFLSQKEFNSKGITSQKNPGWVLYSSGGTFAWSIGSGNRRINYERDNGYKMPVNDGEWHQLTISYNKKLSEFRLYYDGINKAIYNVGFDFTNNEPLVIGSTSTEFDFDNEFLPEIISGATELQTFVDEFNSMGLENIEPEEFIDLIVNPDRLFNEKLINFEINNKESKSKPGREDLDKALDIRKKFGSNPYTVYQNRELTNLKPISKIYSLKDNNIFINKLAARFYTKSEKLYPSDFSIDELSIWNRTISAEEVLTSYSKHVKVKPIKQEKNLKNLTLGVWNIWHGGKHFSTDKDGWDSRLRIVEMLKDNNADVILMQESYSSGDFIASELGYYYATTSDWDYCFQGANISVMSRFPIIEIKVFQETEFNNVAVKLAISETQEIYAMSNWYGMAQFPLVYDFHKTRFENSDKTPILFGGDFNAVPHTDGGNSPASKKMLEEGFSDAFRSLYPDVDKYPGPSHRSGSRIDQLYYKGSGLKNISTEVISTWPTGFPSDHFLIISTFKLDY